MTGEFHGCFWRRHNAILQCIHALLHMSFAVLYSNFFFFFMSSGGTWVNVASQAPTKSWPERNGQFQRVDQRKNPPDHRNFSQV